MYKHFKKPNGSYFENLLQQGRSYLNTKNTELQIKLEVTLRGGKKTNLHPALQRNPDS
jgi:hypothetical protein